MATKTTNAIKTTSNRQKIINNINGFFHSKGITGSPQNRLVLISTFLLLIFGGLLFFGIS